MNVKTISLDIGKTDATMLPIRIRHGDAGGVTIVAHILDNGRELVGGEYEATFCMRLPDGRHYVHDDGVQAAYDPAGGLVLTYVMDEDRCAAVPGTVRECYFSISGGGRTYSTGRVSMEVLDDVCEGAEPGESYDTRIDALLSDLDEAVDRADDALQTANAAASTSAAATRLATEATTLANAAASAASGEATAARQAADAALAAKDAADSSAALAASAASSAEESADAAGRATSIALAAADEARGAVAPEIARYLAWEEDADGDEVLVLIDAATEV